MTDQVPFEDGEGGAGAAPPSWKEAFALRDDLKQRDVYAFEKAVNELGGFKAEGSNILADHALKAAIEAGWLVEPASEVLRDRAERKRYTLEGVNVDDLHPGKVRWYGLRIVGHYSAIVTPPPN